ncbi:GntR family transcriptional regulator [Alloyangia pacifica]|uniref:GntR family transcriptional regulator n=1 Tax=Alloyangia pacifica TaxID=311180 RepID=UPI001CFC531D|nr:GntR family transcriptional regulator [Alloyangia pacifica]
MDGMDDSSLPAIPPQLAPGEQSLSDQAYTRILEMLLAGQLVPGEALQERRLAQMMDISRTPVREALFRLEAEALILRGPGRKLVVNDISIESYVRLLDLRRILEMEAAARATGRISPEKLAEVDEMLHLETVSAAQHWAVDDLVHHTIAEAAGNPMLTRTILDLRRRTHIFNTNRISHRRRPGTEEHLALIRAAAGSDPELTRRLMGTHLDHVRNAIVDFILGIRH